LGPLLLIRILLDWIETATAFDVHLARQIPQISTIIHRQSSGGHLKKGIF
jgi:hypothetical protein